MKHENNNSRRNFIKRSSLGLGAGIAGVSLPSFTPAETAETEKLPGVLSVATIDLRGLWNVPREKRIRGVLRRMEELSGLKPDVICLPELFDTSRINEQFRVEDIAEEENVSGAVTGRIAEFARKHACYVVCPVYTKSNGRYYNSSLLVGRKGELAGAYHKMHPSATEILGHGISAGTLDQPAIETDFGRVGMQIGLDIYWSDGWDKLKKQGAKIILFPSDFPGGKMLNHYALKNSCYFISSSEGDARIIDISGNDLGASSTFIRYGWDNINLKKVIIDAWPTNESLPEIFRKYGHKLRFRIWDNNWTATVESLDPGLNVRDIFTEFKIAPSDELLKRTEEVQKKYRL